MTDFVYIGPVPPEEKCEPAGGDPIIARRECKAYIGLLRRALGKEPDGATLRIQHERGGNGGYYEVVCDFDKEKPASLEYALKCEGDGPQDWDEMARAELREKKTRTAG